MDCAQERYVEELAQSKVNSKVDTLATQIVVAALATHITSADLGEHINKLAIAIQAAIDEGIKEVGLVITTKADKGNGG